MGVAFFTLIERKIIRLIHFRKGPNKVITSGLAQPIADAIKLLTKETTKFKYTKVLIILTGPVTAIALIIISWG